MGESPWLADGNLYLSLAGTQPIFASFLMKKRRRALSLSFYSLFFRANAMTRIHPTAVIEPGARIHETVEIGPYAVIGPHVTVGANTSIGSHSVIEGHTTLGTDNRIAHFVALGGAPQDKKYAGEPTRLDIGNHNTIREFATIHTGTIQDAGVTRVGDHNWIMGYVHIAHDCVVGDHTIFSSNAQIAGHVQVGDWAILGGMSGVHQFVRVGAHAILGGGSIAVKDLPPFILAAGEKAKPHGLNLEGLRRRGFSSADISSLQSAYRTLYSAHLSFEEAKNKLAEDLKILPEQSPVQIFLHFLQQTTRGIIR